MSGRHAPGSIAMAAAVGLVAAAVLGLVADQLEVNWGPAVLGALIGAGIEIAGSLRAGPTPVPVVARTAPPAAPAPPQFVPTATPAATPTSHTAPNVPPVPPVAPARPRREPGEPVTIDLSDQPLTETPCPTCGLYPAGAPDPRALPTPGSHSSLGLS